jgi:hypothetical protein
MVQDSDKLLEFNRMIDAIMLKKGWKKLTQFCNEYSVKRTYLYQILNELRPLSNQMFLTVKGIFHQVCPEDSVVSEPLAQYVNAAKDSNKLKVTITMTLDGAMVQSHNISVEKV